jgi:hypothetical protein
VNPGGTGGCFASIQAAVNAAEPGEVIQVDAGTYAENVLIGAGARLTIQGVGAATTIVDAGGSGDVLAVVGSGPASTVALSGLTVRNGGAYGLRAFGARMTVTACTIEGNALGGIRAQAYLVGNTAIRTVLTVTESTIDSNSSPGPLAAGIDVRDFARLRLIRSTVSNNTTSDPAAAAGVGIGGHTSARIEDSTLSDNSGKAVRSSAVLRIQRSTIVGAGSSLATLDASLGRITLKGTIVRDTTSTAVCSGDVASRGENLIEPATGCVLQPNDLTGSDPLLGPLAPNGGPTETHALLAGSPALEEATRGCRKPDQRGVTREPAPCDIGAFEAP